MSIKITIFAKPGSRKEEVWWDQIKQMIVVSVNARPTDGQANDSIVRAVAKKLKIGPTKVVIISGFSARQKTLDIYSELSLEELIKKLSS